MALTACKTALMPRLAQSGQYRVLDVLVAVAASLALHAFLVESDALYDDVVSSNAATALVARKEISRTVLAHNLSVVVKVRAVQLRMTFSALEMLLVEMLTTSINVLVSEEGISTLVAVRLATGAARGRWHHH